MAQRSWLQLCSYWDFYSRYIGQPQRSRLQRSTRGYGSTLHKISACDGALHAQFFIRWLCHCCSHSSGLGQVWSTSLIAVSIIWFEHL